MGFRASGSSGVVDVWGLEVLNWYPAAVDACCFSGFCTDYRIYMHSDMHYEVSDHICVWSYLRMTPYSYYMYMLSHAVFQVCTQRHLPSWFSPFKRYCHSFRCGHTIMSGVLTLYSHSYRMVDWTKRHEHTRICAHAKASWYALVRLTASVLGGRLGPIGHWDLESPGKSTSNESINPFRLSPWRVKLQIVI